MFCTRYLTYMYIHVFQYKIIVIEIYKFLKLNFTFTIISQE